MRKVQKKRAPKFDLCPEMGPNVYPVGVKVYLLTTLITLFNPPDRLVECFVAVRIYGGISRCFSPGPLASQKKLFVLMILTVTEKTF